MRSHYVRFNKDFLVIASSRSKIFKIVSVVALRFWPGKEQFINPRYEDFKYCFIFLNSYKLYSNKDEFHLQ